MQCHIADVDRLRSRTWSCVPAQRHLRLHPKKSGSEPRVTICLARSGAVATQLWLLLGMDTPWDGPVKPCIPDVLLPALYSPRSLPLTKRYLHLRSPNWPDDSWKPDYVPWQRTKTFSSGVLKPWWNGKQGFPCTSQGLTWEGHSYIYTSLSELVLTTFCGYQWSHVYVNHIMVIGPRYTPHPEDHISTHGLSSLSWCLCCPSKRSFQVFIRPALSLSCDGWYDKYIYGHVPFVDLVLHKVGPLLQRDNFQDPMIITL